MYKIKRLTQLVLLFFLSLFLTEEIVAQVTCSASAPPRVAVGNTFEYKVALNEKPSNIVSTSFADFRLVGGPQVSSSSSITIANGQTVQNFSYVYTYYLQAEKQGSFVIPGAVFTVKGQQVKSNNVTVNVVEASQSQQATQGRQSQPQSAPPTLDKDEVFIKAYASKTNPYQGEQITVTYKLYVGPSINGGYQIGNVNLPSQNGLWTYQLGDPNTDAPRTTETVNGKRYTVYEIRKMAVFPQKSGEITISPFEVDFHARIIYQVQGGRSIFDQFFGGGQRAQDYKLSIKSNSVKLNVKSLPAGNKPDDFSGLVGNFDIKSQLSRSELKSNDATNLTVTISGNGNIQHIEAPIIQFPPDFDVSEPKVTDNINTHGSTVSGSRVFEYVIIPRSHGKFTIPEAQFNYFDLRSNSYKTVSTETFDIQVEKGEGADVNTTSYSSHQKDIKILDRDIRFIKYSDRSFSKKSEPFFASTRYFIWLLLPVLLFALFLWIWHRQIKLRQNEILVRDKKANKVARKRLKKANKLINDPHSEAFYIEISKALWGYISDKFHIPLAQLSMQTVESKLKEKGLDEDSIQEFLSTLHRCEFARFAPGDPEQLKQEMYEQTLHFITNIEKNNKR